MKTNTAGSEEKAPLSATLIATGVHEAGAGPAGPGTEPLPWTEARALLAEARSYWLATAGPGGAPQVRPVLAVWVDGALYTTTNPAAAKARNLGSIPRCAVSTGTDRLDLVVEGSAARRVDADGLQRVADAYREKYDWPVTVKDGAFDAPYGAPTSGLPPYHVYEITPAVVFGFGVAEATGPRSTRWQF